MGQPPVSFSFIFGLFKQTIQFCTTNQCEIRSIQYTAQRIRTRDLSNMSRHPNHLTRARPDLDQEQNSCHPFVFNYLITYLPTYLPTYLYSFIGTKSWSSAPSIDWSLARSWREFWTKTEKWFFKVFQLKVSIQNGGEDDDDKISPFFVKIQK